MKKEFDLPWGATIYKGFYKNHEVQIASYTEPSVYWDATSIKIHYKHL